MISMASRRCRQSGTLTPQQPTDARGLRLYLSGLVTVPQSELPGLSYRRTIATVLPRERPIATEAAATITQREGAAPVAA
jgi:hypothetical protein